MKWSHTPKPVVKLKKKKLNWKELEKLGCPKLYTWFTQNYLVTLVNEGLMSLFKTQIL